MPTVIHPSTPDLDALDRGVREAGLLAAEAMARAEVAELHAAQLERILRVAFEAANVRWPETA